MIAGALALLAVLFSRDASAQYPFYIWDLRTELTFSAPVGLPGITLPAGTYVFRFPSRSNARQVIQVVSRDRKTVYALLMTASAWRPIVTHTDQVVFGESPADAPPRIAIWYPAHEQAGYEFLYSKETKSPFGRAGN